MAKSWYELTESDLKKMRTLSTGQDADLKFDDGEHRVWLSRCGPEDWDGHPGYKKISYERLVNGRWVEVEA